MASALRVFVLCLASGLMIVANGKRICKADCCPAGWTDFENRCYLFQPSEKEWSDAERHCTSLGGNLASIQTSGEYNFLRDLIHKATNTHKETWVGGYDAPKNNVWLWSDGSQFDFKGWAQGEPNDVGGEGCMEMNFKGGDYVNDIKCNQKQSFVCAM
ncbi:galactose-specific lectin nattectin-like [Tautogolabrus adspersus]